MTGRPRTCSCDECPKCKRRIAQKRWWDSLTPERRAEQVAKRDREATRRRERERGRKMTPERRETSTRWQREHPEEARQVKVEWARRNREKRRAHNAVNNAIRSGKLNRDPCEVCGAVNTHGHHDDYSKPLEVRWLCPKHHSRAHWKAA